MRAFPRRTDRTNGRKLTRFAFLCFPLPLFPSSPLALAPFSLSSTPTPGFAAPPCAGTGSRRASLLPDGTRTMAARSTTFRSEAELSKRRGQSLVPAQPTYMDTATQRTARTPRRRKRSTLSGIVSLLSAPLLLLPFTSLTSPHAALALAMSRDGSSGGTIRMAIITKEGVERVFVPGDQLPRFWEKA